MFSEFQDAETYLHAGKRRSARSALDAKSNYHQCRMYIKKTEPTVVYTTRVSSKKKALLFVCTCPSAFDTLNLERGTVFVIFELDRLRKDIFRSPRSFHLIS